MIAEKSRLRSKKPKPLGQLEGVTPLTESDTPVRPARRVVFQSRVEPLDGLPVLMFPLCAIHPFLRAQVYD